MISCPSVSSNCEPKTNFSNFLIFLVPVEQNLKKKFNSKQYYHSNKKTT